MFYEVLVRAFADSKGSGAGDFTGLVQRLDYLQWLGIDCLWLPPFYASPLRDGGYDISDYTAVLPEFGTLPEFTELVSPGARPRHPDRDGPRHEPHLRPAPVVPGLAGPTPRARTATSTCGPTTTRSTPTRGSSSSTPRSRNWTFDPIRRQFFWHRFFSHQPDLNFDNPDVQEAMFDIVRFWMDLGIDGFRLDAVPYLFEEEGTNCENLPATHEFLAKLRAMVDEEYPGRVLLAEANQLPSEVVDYFGTEEAPECQMCFHFPVMPRLYYSLREEKAAPIIDVLADTPPIPPGTQWGTFLRNHDELTLEMVSPEERAAMYGWYAPDPRMRANVGIRRRLAPLLDNSRAEIELIHALLLSLPGSPCLYYGDEIGMGDNIWLNDRDAVRTPMQWTPDRNSGFSSVDPGKLYLPVISSLVYHYNNINVEAQIASSSSLLHWLRGMLADPLAPPGVRARLVRGVPGRERHRSWRSCARSTAVSSTTSSPRRCSASTTCRAARRPASSGCPTSSRVPRWSTSSAAAASPRSPTRRR